MAGRKKIATKKKPKKSTKKIVKTTSKKKNLLIINSNILVLGFLVVLLVILIGITLSYAFWFTTESQKNHNNVTAGCLGFSLNDKDIHGNVTSINLTNTYPMLDDKGLKLSPYTLTITNTCTIQANISLYLHNLENSSIDSRFIKSSLMTSDNTVLLEPTLVSDINNGAISNDAVSTIESEIGDIKESYLLNNVLLDPDKSITFNLRMWIDYDAPNSIMGLSYNSAVSVYATTPE